MSDDIQFPLDFDKPQADYYAQLKNKGFFRGGVAGTAEFSDRAKHDADEVQIPNSAWSKMVEHWELIEDLNEGSTKIRQRKHQYLPQMPREDTVAYETRLSTSVCPPYLQRLERMLSGMLTRKSIRLTDVSDKIREQLFNVNLLGDDLQSWLFDISRICISYGHVGVLVDAPKDGTDKDRPYWVAYTPRQIIGWRYKIEDGELKLKQVRLKEEVVEPYGRFGERHFDQIRVLEEGKYILYRKEKGAGSGEYEKFEEGQTTLDYIPFAVAYSHRKDVLVSSPPLQDVAELTLKYYQIQSDLDNQLRISAVPLLAFFGFPPDRDEIATGPNEALSLAVDGRAEWIEPSGNSFSSQFQRLDQLREQINELGLANVLGQKMGAETAESKRIDRSQGDATLMNIAQQLQDMIDNLLKFHADFVGEKQAGSCFVNRDFVDARLEPAEIQSLLQLYTAGTISHKTLLEQLESGEILGDDFEIEEEIKEVEAAGLLEMEQPMAAPATRQIRPKPEKEEPKAKNKVSGGGNK